MNLHKQQQQQAAAPAPVISSFGTQVGGRFKLIVHGGKRGRISTGWFDNLITNAGLRALLSTSSIAARCVVGSSSQVPAATDTTIVDRLSGVISGSAVKGYDAANKMGWTRYTYSFDPGAATGNVREVGITLTTSATGNLFSRALVRDASGQPATITVLSDEYLTVIYELRRKWITPAPYTLSYTFAGQTHTTTVTHPEPLYNGVDNGVSGGLIALTLTPYFNTADGNSLLSTAQFGDIEILPSGATMLISTSLPPNKGSSGIAALQFNRINAYGTESIPINRVMFNPRLLKDNQHSLNINLRLTITRL